MEEVILANKTYLKKQTNQYLLIESISVTVECKAKCRSLSNLSDIAAAMKFIKN